MYLAFVLDGDVSQFYGPTLAATTRQTGNSLMINPVFKLRI